MGPSPFEPGGVARLYTGRIIAASVVWRRALLVLLFFIRRFLLSLVGGAFDRVVHDLAGLGIDIDLVDAIRHLDVEGIDQTSFFAFKLAFRDCSSFLGQGHLSGLFHSDLRFFAQFGLAGLALIAAP